MEKNHGDYYRELRKKEDPKLSRMKAVEKMDTVSERRLEEIELGNSTPHPEEILEMAKAYKSPELCNYYCSNVCAIGKVSVPEVKLASLPEIVLKMVATLNQLENERNCLIQITEDGVIADDEISDFVRIQKELDKILITANALKLWTDSTISQGKLNRELLQEYQEKSKE